MMNVNNTSASGKLIDRSMFVVSRLLMRLQGCFTCTLGKQPNWISIRLLISWWPACRLDMVIKMGFAEVTGDYCQQEGLAIKKKFHFDIFIIEVNCYIDSLVQDCNNSIANALELLQYCPKPLIKKPCSNIAWQWHMMQIDSTLFTKDNP